MRTLRKWKRVQRIGWHDQHPHLRAHQRKADGVHALQDVTQLSQSLAEHPRIDIRTFGVFMEKRCTQKLRQAILILAACPDVHCVSCALTDFALWQGLFREQVARAQAHGGPPQEAFALMGPEGGIPGITPVVGGLEEPDDSLPPVEPDPQGNFAPDRWGGDVHIPYEGVCSGDLLIAPQWMQLYPRALLKPDATFHSMSYKKFNLLLLARDLGQLPHSVRTELDQGWWLYESTSPFLDCNPFHDVA